LEILLLDEAGLTHVEPDTLILNCNSLTKKIVLQEFDFEQRGAE
jgi:hypothetical protein